MASSRQEKINGLQDLVERMSREFPLPAACIENAKTQYKILQGNMIALKDGYSDLKKVVFKAEEIGITGSEEARAEFDVLLQHTAVPEHRQAQVALVGPREELAANNPNIANLSERNLPKKLGEKFEQLYDNKWSEAFEYLKGIPMDDDQILQTLVDISKKAYKFCQDFAQQELERLESHFIDVMTYIKWTYKDSDGKTGDMRVHRSPEDKSAFLGLRLMVDARKACATASVPALVEMFKEHVYREHFSMIPLTPRLENYVDMCVEFSFLMVVQDPPMYLEYPESGQKINTSLFKPSMKKGLSSFASKERAANNPNIADLSDRNTPTKLGEKFEQLYDNEWSEAFEYLRGIPMDEDQILQTLVDILQKAYELSQDFAKQELERLESHIIDVMTYIKWTYEDIDGRTGELRVHRNPKDKSAFLELNRLMVDARKACATASVPALTEVFKSHVFIMQFNKIRMETRLENYINRCVECSFLMVVQDPPMYLEYPESGQKINTSLFKPFRQKGSVVQMCVWPSVCLHKDGPVVCKGYVLPQ